MKDFLKKTLKSLMICLLSAAMVVTSCLYTKSQVVSAEEEKEDFNIVTIGDSVTNGFGFDDYYPESGNPDSNVRGFKVEADEAFPHLLKEHFNEGYNANLTQLAAAAMRPEDLYAIMHPEFTRDDYTNRVFSVCGKLPPKKPGGEKWIETWYNKYVGKSATDEEKEAWVHDEYINAIKDADLITYNLGINCFGTFLTARLPFDQLGLEGLKYSDTDTLQDLLNRSNVNINVEDKKQEIIQLIKEYIGIDVAQYLGTVKIPGTEAEISVDEYVDLIVHAYCSFAIYFEKNIEDIRTLNPNAKIVVMGLFNTQNDLYIDLNGEHICIGDFYGKLLEMADIYMQVTQSSDEYAFVDTANLNVERFFDEIRTEKMSDSMRNRMIEQLFSFKDKDGSIFENTINSAFEGVLGGLVLAEEKLHLDFSATKAIFDTGHINVSKVKNSFKVVFDEDNANERVKLASDLFNALMADLLKYKTGQGLDEQFMLKFMTDVEALSSNSINSNELVVALLSSVIEVLVECSKLETIDVNALLEILASGQDPVSLVAAALSDPSLLNPGIKGLVNLFLRFMFADGICVHPNINGHETMANAIIDAYNSDVTARDGFSNAIIEHLKEYLPIATKEVTAFLEDEIAKVDNISGASNNFIENTNKLSDKLGLLCNELADKLETIKNNTGSALENTLMVSIDAAINELNDANSKLVKVIENVDFTRKDVEDAVTVCRVAVTNLVEVVTSAQKQLREIKDGTDGELYEFLNASLDAMNALVKAVDDYCEESVVIFDNILEAIKKVEEEREDYDYKEYVVNAVKKLVEKASDLENAGIKNILDSQKELKVYLDELTTKYVLPALEDAVKAYKEGTQDVYDAIDSATLVALKGIYGSLDAIYADAVKYEELCNKVKDLHDRVVELKKEIETKYGETIEKIYKTIKELSECRTYEEFISKVREINTYVDELCKKIEETYKEIAEQIAKIEAALAELEAAISDSFKIFDETIKKIREEIDAIKSDVELIKSIFEFMCDYAVNEKYTPNSNSYYVSLGDSIVTGFGFEEDGYRNYGYKTKVVSSFPYLLTEKLELDPETQYTQLAMGGLRAEDILYILDDNYNADQYGRVNVPNDLAKYGEGFEAERNSFKEEIQKADFVTIDMGGNNYGTFVTSQINRYLNGEDLWEMDFNRFGNRQELVDLIKNAVHENEAYFIASLKESGLPVDAAIDFTKLANVYAESFAYGTLGLLDSEWNVLDKIHEINPDAFIGVLGLYNTLDDVYIEKYRIRIDIGKVVDVFKDLVNAYTIAYCGMHAKTVFIPIDEVEMISDSMEYSRNLLDGEVIKHMMADNGLASHPSKAGHEYMAERVLKVINRDYTITYHKTSDEITGTDDGYQEMRTYGDEPVELWVPNWAWTNKTFIGWEDNDGNFYAKGEIYNNLVETNSIDLYCVFIDTPRIKALSTEFNNSGIRVRAFGEGQINDACITIEDIGTDGSETFGSFMDRGDMNYFTYVNEYLRPDTEKLVVSIMTMGNIDYCGYTFETYDECTKEYTKDQKTDDSLNVLSDMWYTFVDGTNEFAYTGKNIKPQLIIYEGGMPLTLGKDYSLSYKNNKNVGKATITVTGKGNYSKSKFNKETIEFEIVPKTEATINLTKSYIAKKNNAAQALTLKVTDGKTTLKANKDYIYCVDDVAYGKLTEPKEYTISIKGIGNYDFEKEETVKVASNTLLLASKLSISLAYSKTNCAYDDTHIAIPNCPEVTIKEGKNIIFKGCGSNNDFDIEYLNNSDVGTASVIVTVKEDGAYAYKYFGSVTKTFKIVGLKLPSNVMQNGLVFKSPKVLYTGSPIELSDLEIWTNSKDESSKLDSCKYDITYEKNIDKGTANIIFTGKEEYTGSTVKKTFKINSKAFDSSIKVEGLESPFTYLKGGVKPTPIVKDNDKTLVLDKDYTLSYKNNTKVGLATLTIKGKGNYAGTIKKQFVVVQANVKDCGTITVTNKKWTTKKNGWKAAVVFKDVEGKQLKVGKDFTATYIYKSTEKEITETTLPAGTEIVVKIEGTNNNFTGTTYAFYKVEQLDISGLKVVVAPKEYTGREIRLSKDDISFYKGLTRVDDVKCEDFEIREDTYINNINKGSNAKVEIIGVNNCIGSKQVTFKIGAKGIIWSLFQKEQLFGN